MNGGFSFEGAINFLLGLIVTIMSFVMKGQNDKITDLTKRFDELHDTYARKDDMKDQFNLIRAQLTRIEDKWDKKYG